MKVIIPVVYCTIAFVLIAIGLIFKSQHDWALVSICVMAFYMSLSLATDKYIHNKGSLIWLLVLKALSALISIFTLWLHYNFRSDLFLLIAIAIGIITTGITILLITISKSADQQV